MTKEIFNKTVRILLNNVSVVTFLDGNTVKLVFDENYHVMDGVFYYSPNAISVNEFKKLSNDKIKEKVQKVEDSFIASIKSIEKF